MMIIEQEKKLKPVCNSDLFGATKKPSNNEKSINCIKKGEENMPCLRRWKEKKMKLHPSSRQSLKN